MTCLFLLLLLLLLQRFVCSTLDLQLTDLHDVSEVAFIFIGKEFHVRPRKIRRIEWVLVRMQKSDQCLRVVVYYVIGLNEMESSTNCKWLHHPNFFFNFEFREDLSRSPKAQGFSSSSFFLSIISLLDYVETWQRPRSGHPRVRLLLLLEMDFSYFYFQRNGLRPEIRRISIFFRCGNGQRPPQRWTSFSIDCKHQHQDTVVWWRIYFGQQ